MKRRALLGGVAACWLGDQLLADTRPITGRIVGGDHRVGHLLRGDPGTWQRVTETERCDVLLVGSGPSALSAAWRLRGADLSMRMLELEPRPGGTSAFGVDGVVAHPWGAHYLPAPELEARPTLRLLEDLGVLTSWDAAGRPLFDAHMLCHAPEERLFYQGGWHDGLVPTDALDVHARRDVERFTALAHELREAVGADGRPALASPIAFSSTDETYRALDRMSMARWLDEQGLRSPFLRWYVEYATLDDYGGTLDEVSAWAGLFYFAARKLETDQLHGSRFLVWPEGNGWLVRNMLARLPIEPTHGALVLKVEPAAKGGVRAEYLDVERGQLRTIEARGAVLATPAFVTRRLVAGTSALPARVSAPWLVANLHVRRPPDPNGAWDSVVHGSHGLGYVDAGHQRTLLSEATVLTYFRAFGQRDVAAARQGLVGASWSELASAVLGDLAVAEPDLPLQTERLDVMIWGHGMPRPEPGFLGRAPAELPVLLDAGIAWAHVDRSGLALFEEASHQGTLAAERLAPALGVSLGESWL